MPRLAALLFFASLVVSAAGAQDFPAPGTGVFTWERVGDRPLDIQSFSFAPDGRLYAARDTVFAFDPAPGGPPAGHWRRLGYPTGFTAALLALDAAGDTLFVANGNGGRITRSTDGGTTWAIVNDGVDLNPGGPKTPDGFFVVPAGHPHAGRLLAGGGILYSDDRGATWTEATRAFPGDAGFAHVFASFPSGQVLMGGNWGMARSGDGGTSYAVTPVWGDYHYQTGGLAALATPGSAQSSTAACGLADPALCDGAVAVGIDATAPDVRAWRTNDGGQTWSEPVPLPEPYDGVGTSRATVVALSPGPDGLGRAISIGGRGVVYATADGGQTWQAVGRMPIRLGAGSHYTWLVRLGPDGHLWVSTTINGPEREWLYRSAEPAEAAFPVAAESAPPSGALRLDVRPNPADGRVTVRLTLDAPTAHATVTVTDALGRRVAVLHDGPLAAGTHAFALATAGLAPGVYTIRAALGAAPIARTFTVAR